MVGFTLWIERDGWARKERHSRTVYQPASPQHTTRPLRTLVILLKLAPLALSFLRDWRRWLFAGAGTPRTQAFHERRASRLVHAFAELGPTFVKLAQVFGSRPDVVPEPYLSALGTLTDKVPSVPFASIHDVLLESYGEDPDSIFDDLAREPIAAGSLGQVYRARYEGREVVVKVLRPGVEQLVEQDLKAIRRFLDFASARWSNAHLRATRVVVEQFALTIAEEMNFRQEAANAQAIAAHFAGNRRVRIPAIESELTRQRVLVMQYVRGTRIDALAPLLAEGKLHGGRVVESVIDVYCQMMLIDGLFHADPHAGNLLVADDGALVLLDFGMVARVEPETRRHLVRTALAAISRDTDGVLQGFYDLGIVEPGADMSTIRRLVEVILAMSFDGVASADMAARVLSDRTLSDDVMRLLLDWPIVLTGEMVYFGRAVSLIEGIGARYVPGFNIVQFGLPIVMRHRRAVLTVLSDGTPRDEGLAATLGAMTGVIARVLVDATRQITSEIVTRMPRLGLVLSDIMGVAAIREAPAAIGSAAEPDVRQLRKLLSA